MGLTELPEFDVDAREARLLCHVSTSDMWDRRQLPKIALICTANEPEVCDCLK